VTAAANRIEIDAVDFQISCRRFTIRATVTRDRQLPVVDEFALRLLAVLERMSVARMRAWFGFSETEIEAVLVDMGRRKYVEFDGDDVVLAPAGRELFRSVGQGGVPQVVEVAPMIDTVWFDLVSRNMVPRSRLANTDYLVRLTEQASAREFPEAFARQAFEENFRDYAKRVRRFPDPDAVNLYSISDVEGGPYGYQLLSAGLVLDTDRMVVRTTFAELGDDVPVFQKLTVAANDAWQAAVPPEATPTAEAEFERMTGSGNLANVIRSPNEAGPWIDAILAVGREEPGFKPTLGATYLPANLAKFVELIAAAQPSGVQTDLVWLRPGGSTWGRTTKIPEVLQQLRAASRNAGRPDLHATLAMPRSTHRTIRTNHKRLFERGLLLPQGHLPANLEVLLFADVAAFVNVHVRMGGHAVPVGGIVTDRKRLARIAERIRPSAASGWDELWLPTKARATDQRLKGD
jgi:hypothetical protein